MQNYHEILAHLREHHFLNPAGTNLKNFETLIATALQNTCNHQGTGPLFGEAVSPLLFGDVTSYILPNQTSFDLGSHMSCLQSYLSGTVKSNHPRMVKNVIPTPTLAYLSSYVAASIYMGNGATAEDAGNAALTEVLLSRIYASLAGYNPEEAGGVFTFGGTGTNLYAFRMGLLGVDPDAFLHGIANNLVVVGSRPAHYSHQTAVSWLGLGRNNYIIARSRCDQTTDLFDLERVCRDQIERGKKIVCVVGVGGTTSCMGIDDFASLSAIIDTLVADYNLPYRPHLHADSVIGWAYLHFTAYDFAANPLAFDEEVLSRLKSIVAQIATLKWADTYGIDFHKTGYVPYVSSMLIAKSRKQLAALGQESDMMTPLFHNSIAYNPGKYTLETSRSSANMVATLMSVTALGLEGFQTLLGHAQAVSIKIKTYVRDNKADMLIVNRDTYGSDIFVRVYPRCFIASTTFSAEATDAALRAYITNYNNNFFQFLSNHHAFGSKAIAISKTSAAYYTDADLPVIALRLYILNPFLDYNTAIQIVDILGEAKAEFDAQYADHIA